MRVIKTVFSLYANWRIDFLVFKGVPMMKHRGCFGACIILLFLFGCHQKLPRTVIDIPDAVKKALEEAAPTAQYRFCALAGSSPELYEDLKRSDLYVCGEIDNQVGLRIAIAPLGESQSLLFGRIRRFFINPNVLAGEMSMTETTKITPEGGGVFVIPCEHTIYGKDHSFKRVLGDCLEDMEKNRMGILLLERKKSLDADTLSKIVEIVFR